MDVQWTLVVEDLGRIKRAEVRLHPLMLLVGENDSGKSQLMALLWGLIALKAGLFPPEAPDSAAYAACERWLQQHPVEVPVPLEPEDCQVFLHWVNEVLAERRQSIVSSIFNDPHTTVSRLEIRDLRRDKPLRVEIKVDLVDDEPQLMAMEDAVEQGRVVLTAPVAGWRSPEARYAAIRRIAWSMLMGDMARLVGSSAGVYLRGDPLYLPASRAGLMLLYKSVVRRQLKQLLEWALVDQSVKLTRPAVHFLELMTVGLKDIQGAYSAEADFLEQGSLQGRLSLETGVGGNEYRYHPGGAARALPMSLSSSLVSELAPLILALRHVPELPVLALEEPEAHLHPRLQRLLAQVLVRLVRQGVKVWVTTHSENFCQQINNFLKLGQLPNRMEVVKQQGWPYGEQDYLEMSEVAGYQFVNKGPTSVVSELEKSPEGLSMPTFNDELMSLVKETLFLQRLTAGVGDGT